MERTYTKELKDKVGKEVILFGWVDTKRDHGKVTFIDMRDTSGLVQCVAAGNEDMKSISEESVVKIEGLVKERPENMVNEKEENGSIEIEVQKFEVLNKSKELPIPIKSEGLEIKEEARLKYRYIDLRRARMQKNMKLRSDFTREVREFLYNKGFVEVETPILTKSTKEGARDFIVPSRNYPGKFYALPQAPQQYKQLLMTSGIERYFQIARCMRDEDLRADRGYEFSQIDLEMSFVSRQDVMSLVEDLVKTTIKKVGGKIKEDPFPVFDYKDALKKYGSDKFDLRTEEDKKKNVLAFAWVENFPFFKKVNKEDAVEVQDTKSDWTFTHNPFSNPIPDHKQKHLKGEDIGGIITDQYDLVCNGYEAGGGSIRAHESEVLKATYKVMGYDDKYIEESIGHMLEAFKLGTPPHGGIALGLDRLLMILANETSLKEVIPFPMTSSGRTSIMDAPAEVDKSQLDDLSIKT